MEICCSHCFLFLSVLWSASTCVHVWAVKQNSTTLLQLQTHGQTPQETHVTSCLSFSSSCLLIHGFPSGETHTHTHRGAGVALEGACRFESVFVRQSQTKRNRKWHYRFIQWRLWLWIFDLSLSLSLSLSLWLYFDFNPKRKNHSQFIIKGTVHLKMKSMSSITHPHIVPNLYDFLFMQRTQKKVWRTLFHAIFIFGDRSVYGVKSTNKSGPYNLCTIFQVICSHMMFWARNRPIFSFWTSVLALFKGLMREQCCYC